MRMKYPEIHRSDDAYDDFHGTSVPNPYVWLEDPDSEETRAFVADQNAISMPFLRDSSVYEKFNSRYVMFFCAVFDMIFAY